MKTKNTILFLSSLLLLLIGSSCEKDKDVKKEELSFSCHINGEKFAAELSPNEIGTEPTGQSLSFTIYDDYFNVESSDSNYFIYIAIINPTIGTFDLNISHGLFGLSDPNILNHAIIKFNDTLYVSNENSGSVTITNISDTNIEGTFEFTLYNENNNSDVLTITNGKFVRFYF